MAVPALLAIRRSTRAGDPALFRTVIGAAIGSLALLLSLLKQGSYLNVIVVIEPPALILAACGWTWLLTDAAFRNARRLLIVVGLALVLGLIEIGSMLASPEHPTLFGRPFAASLSMTSADDRDRLSNENQQLDGEPEIDLAPEWLPQGCALWKQSPG